MLSARRTSGSWTAGLLLAGECCWYRCCGVALIQLLDFSGAIPAGLTIRLSCTDHQGAALVIKRRAIREDTRCGKAFRDLFLKNHETWYAFVRDELQTDISMNDILFVTGHILTNEWATATVVEKTRDCEIRFNAGDGLGAFGGCGASASVWGSWTSSVSLPLRFGPTSLPPIQPNDRNAAQTTSQPLNITSVRTTDSSNLMTLNPDETQDAPPNQCIFVRAYRILSRPFFLRKITAAAEPKDEDENEEKHYPLAVRVGLDSDDDSEMGELEDDSEPSVSAFIV